MLARLRGALFAAIYQSMVGIKITDKSSTQTIESEDHFIYANLVNFEFF